MVTSKTKNENYLHYLILEIIMVMLVTFLGVAIFLFYVIGKSDTRAKTNNLEYFFDNPLIFTLTCSIPVVFSIVVVLYFRNRNYIIGFDFNNELQEIKLLYRGILSRKNQEFIVKFDQITIDSFFERKILFNIAYKGVRIQTKDEKLKLDFVTNNFIWENQPREKLAFLEKMEKITENFKKNPPKTN